MADIVRPDRDRQHIKEALEKGRTSILEDTDLPLLYANNRQRTTLMDEMTIRDARETVVRLGAESKRLRIIDQALTEARAHLKRTIGKDDDGDDL